MKYIFFVCTLFWPLVAFNQEFDWQREIASEVELEVDFNELEAMQNSEIYWELYRQERSRLNLIRWPSEDKLMYKIGDEILKDK